MAEDQEVREEPRGEITKVEMKLLHARTIGSLSQVSNALKKFGGSMERITKELQNGKRA